MNTHRKVAVVTGASRGIGASTAQAFLDRGYQVVGAARSIAPSDNPDYLTIAGDIADPAVAKAVIDQAIARFGRVDTLVNNAGVFIPGAFEGYTAEQYRQVLATNLDGFFFVTQNAIAVMLEQGSGHIVQLSATIVEHALSAVPSVLASVTKGALNAATRSLAIEYARRNIRVNAVAPGMIKTPMHAPETLAFLAGLHPVNRMGEAEDIVRGILYLEDAGFVTGEILHVDGGQSAGH